jgi:hypothetical protein
VLSVKDFGVGGLFTSIDGDVWDQQPAFQFPDDMALPNLISGNGMLNNEDSAKIMSITVGSLFGVEKSVYIRNDHGYVIGDLLQAVGHLLGGVDKPAQCMAAAIIKGVEQKGMVFVTCHSQGTAYFKQALKLLSPEVRSRVHYLGLGPQQIIDGKREGLASATNVWNKGDKIPGLLQNKVMGVLNRFLPGYVTNGRMREMRASGELVVNRKIDGKSPNPHAFVNYEGAVQSWADDMKKIWNDFRMGATR